MERSSLSISLPVSSSSRSSRSAFRPCSSTKHKLPSTWPRFAAAEKATQVLPQLPEYYDEEPIYTVNYDGSPPGEDPLLKKLSQASLITQPPPLVRGRRGGPRLQAIRSAAYVRLLAAAPDPDDIVTRTSWSSALGGIPEDRVEFAASVYNRVASSVTFLDHEGERSFKYGRDSDVQARVTFLVPCTVPLVSALMCFTWESIQAQRPDTALEELDEAVASRRPGANPHRGRASQFRAGPTSKRG